MYCSSCGSKTDDDAKFCDHCGADLTAMPRPAGAIPMQAQRPLPAPPPAPTYYPPTRPKAWWYPIGVWIILASFFLFIDLLSGGLIEWAYWPIGITGIFMVGFPLLNLLEEKLGTGRRFGP